MKLVDRVREYADRHPLGMFIRSSAVALVASAALTACVIYHSDGTYGSVAVVPQDPTCR